MILVFAIMLLFWWAATEWTAWRLGFQPELGAPWFMHDHRWAIYAPPLFFWWWYEFDAYAPDIFVHGARIGVAGVVLAVTVAFALSIWRARA